MADGGDVGHVERREFRSVPNGLRGGGNLAHAARHQRHLRAVLGQRGGGGQPDPPPCSGHQRALAVEAEGGGLGNHNSPPAGGRGRGWA